MTAAARTRTPTWRQAATRATMATSTDPRSRARSDCGTGSRETTFRFLNGGRSPSLVHRALDVASWSAVGRVHLCTRRSQHRPSQGASRTTTLDSRVANFKAVSQQPNGHRALKQLDFQGPAVAHKYRAPRVHPKLSRGGQGSRARRLQKFQEASGVCPARWWPLVQGMMLMHRANLREATLTTWERSQSARAKLRDGLWRAWVCRFHLKIVGPHND